jgi:hypothetical protein
MRNRLSTRFAAVADGAGLAAPVLAAGAVLAGAILVGALLLGAADGRLHPAAALAPGADPVAIDVLVRDGRPDTLRLVPGVRYRIDEIDHIATDRRAENDELEALITESEFAPLDWEKLALAFSDTAHGLDGRPFLREIYRDADWMTGAHRFTMTPLTAAGEFRGSSIVLVSEADRRAIPTDDFPVRRPAVIREHRDGLYQSEALMQLRNASAHQADPAATFLMDADVGALDMEWEAPGGVLRYRVPVVPVQVPPFAYGFGCDLELVNPPPRGGSYQPGDMVEVDVVFRDGAGNRLHPPGSLPTYNEFRRGLASGLRYYDFFPAVLFFKDKNKEGVMLFALTGPTSRVRQIYFEVGAGQLSEPQQIVAIPRRDGYVAIWQTMPPANVLFGGLADSTVWDTPVSDRLRFAIPGDAPPGRYSVIGKARRVFLSESSLVTAEVAFDVSGIDERPMVPVVDGSEAGSGAGVRSARTPLKDEEGFAVCRLSPGALPAPEMEPDGVADGAPEPGSGRLWVGKCKDCHANGFELGSLLHMNDNAATCAACHAPLVFEPDNMLAYRTHFVHFFSRRYPVAGDKCSACHYTKESVERVSRLVCLSCHVTYHGGADEFGNYRSCAFAKCHDGAHNLF